MKSLFILIIGFLSVQIHCQVWTYRAITDTVSGNYKASSVQGAGTEWPYTRPLFIIDAYGDSINDTDIYFTKVPCACCANPWVMIKFDDEEKRYNFRAATNKSEDIWFLEFKKESVRWDTAANEWIDYATDKDDADKFHNFIKNLKTHAKMYVRLSNDCRIYRCEFSLKGSTVALNFVFREIE
jgi:hypothetical protein